MTREKLEFDQSLIAADSLIQRTVRRIRTIDS